MWFVTVQAAKEPFQFQYRWAKYRILPGSVNTAKVKPPHFTGGINMQGVGFVQGCPAWRHRLRVRTQNLHGSFTAHSASVPLQSASSESILTHFAGCPCATATDCSVTITARQWIMRRRSLTSLWAAAALTHWEMHADGGQGREGKGWEGGADSYLWLSPGLGCS